MSLFASDLITVFAWETPSPFYMIPDHGMLSAGDECTIKVVFQPKVAVVCDVAATCWFGGEEKLKRTLQLKARGESFVQVVLKVMCIVPNRETAFRRDAGGYCVRRLGP